MLCPPSTVNPSYPSSARFSTRSRDVAFDARADGSGPAGSVALSTSGEGDGWAGKAPAGANSPRRGGLLAAALPAMGGLITGSVRFAEALTHHRGGAVAIRRLLVPLGTGAALGAILGATVYAVRRRENALPGGRAV